MTYRDAVAVAFGIGFLLMAAKVAWETFTGREK
jgi:hypothetical protein